MPYLGEPHSLLKASSEQSVNGQGILGQGERFVQGGIFGEQYLAEHCFAHSQRFRRVVRFGIQQLILDIYSPPQIGFGHFVLSGGGVYTRQVSQRSGEVLRRALLFIIGEASFAVLQRPFIVTEAVVTIEKTRIELTPQCQRVLGHCVQSVFVKADGARIFAGHRQRVRTIHQCQTLLAQVSP